MNQQEIDRLFEKHGKVRHVNGADGRYMSLGLMYRGEFTTAIQEATAQARREALEEAANICASEDERYFAKMTSTGDIIQGAKANGCRACYKAIRALAQKEGKHD